MANLYFYGAGDQQFGPFSGQQLKQLASQGSLRPTDLVWQDGTTKKVAANKVHGLAFSSETVAPSAPPQLPPEPQPNLSHAPQSVSQASVASPQTASAPLSAADTFASMTATTKGLMSGLFNKVAEASTSLQQKSTAAAVNLRNKTSQPEVGSGNEVTNQQAPRDTSSLIRQAGIDPEDVIADVAAHYVGGHPEFTVRADGRLLLTSSGVCFVATQSAQSIRIPYDSVGTILEPKLGSFSAEMLKRAEATKTAATLGRFAAGFAGGMIGGAGGRVVRAVGASAAGSVQGNLGAPPKNRLVVVMVNADSRHNLMFDVMATTREIMEECAHSFWMQSATVREKFAKPNSAKPAQRPQDATAEGASQPIVTASIVNDPASSTERKFRVLRRGKVLGSYSAAEIRAQAISGALGADALVAVETWVPIGILTSFVSGHGQHAPSASTAAAQQAGNESRASGSLVRAPSSSSPPDQRGRGLSTAAKIAGGAAAGLAAAALVSTVMHPNMAHGASGGPGNTGSDDAVPLDTDGDGQADAIGLDRNHDGRIDAVGLDTDGDGRIDTVGLDNNFDGRMDVAAMDRDGDGEFETAAADLDHDGRIDAVGADLDHNGTIDAVGLDRDEDGDIDAIGIDVNEDGNVDAAWAVPDDAQSELLEDTVTEGFDASADDDYDAQLEDSMPDEIASDDFDDGSSDA